MNAAFQRPNAVPAVPTLLFAQDALDMINYYVNAPQDTEVSGFAYVRRIDGTNTYFVACADDVFITEQVVTPGSAHIDGHAVARAFERAVEQGRQDELRLQWHSHPGDSYFSPTDMANVANFGNTFEWCIHVVTNRWGEMHARFDAYRPVRVGVEIEVKTHRPPNPYLRERAEAEVGALVKTLVEEPKRRGRGGSSTLVPVTTIPSSRGVQA